MMKKVLLKIDKLAEEIPLAKDYFAIVDE